MIHVDKIKGDAMGRNKSEKGPNFKKKGKPSGNVAENPGIKDINLDKLDESLEMGEKYTEGADEPAQNVMHRHQNRNLNKVDIDKPPY